MAMDNETGVKVPKGQINYNTVAGSLGLAAFAGMAGGGCGGCGGGILGGLFGGNRGGVSQSELAYAQMLDAARAEAERLRAEKYSDQSGIELYKAIAAASQRGDDRINAIVKEVTQAFVQDKQELAVLQTKVACIEERITHQAEIGDYKLGAVKRELEGAIALESERRRCGEQNLYNYVNATFVPGQLVMPASAICPPVMPRYNTWTAPASSAPEQVEVTSAGKPTAGK